MEYAIDLAGMAELQAQLARAPEMVREELLAAVTEADMLLMREVQERMPVGATGALRASVFHEERAEGLGVSGYVGSAQLHATPVELGTRPHMPPVEPLVDWVRAKLGIREEKLARGAAFAIARAIARRGTKPQRPFGLAFQAAEAEVRRIFERAQARIAARLAGGAT